MKCVNLVNQSTMTYKALNPPLTFYNPTTKFIETSSHFHSRMVKGCNNSYDHWYSILTCSQIMHFDTKICHWLFISDYQYIFFKSWYIFTLPRGGVKCTMCLYKKLSLQVIILRDKYSIPKPQDLINCSKILFKSTNNPLCHLYTPLMNNLPYFNLIQIESIWCPIWPTT